jgi:signal transduction histidine kinase/TPR repeat protein
MKTRLFLVVFLMMVAAFSQSVEDQIEKNYIYYKEHVSTKPDSALIYLLRAERLNKTLKDKSWDADLSYAIGYCYFVMQKYNIAVKRFEEAIEQAEGISNYNILSKAYNSIGLIYSFQNKTKIALDYYYKSLNVSEHRDELNDNTISVLGNIADLYIMQQDTVNARRYYEQAKILGEKEDKRLNLAVIYNNVAVSYMTSNKDSTEVYLTKAINIYRDTGNTHGQIRAQNNLATTILNFNSKEDFPKALSLLEESLKLSKESNDIEGEYFSNFYLGNYYEKADINYRKGLDYYNRAYELIKKGFNNETTLELYKRLSKVYYELGDFNQAYRFQSIQHKLQDSIFSIEKNKEFIETLTKFDVERKNNQIQLLNKEKEIQRASKRLIFIVSLLLIIPLVLLAVFYKKRLVYQETISRQDKLLFEKEKESIRAKNLIKGQKQERSRIAKELHDGVGGKLAAINIKIDQLNTTNIQNEELKECIGQLQDTAKEIRLISHALNDSELNEINFVDLLKQLIKDYQLFFSGDIHLNVFPVEKFDKIEDFRKHFLYRVLQEILSNAIKYAEARNINIDCTFDESFRFIIEDDGKGFDPERVKLGMGLNNIKKRVQSMNGEIYIDSAVGRGSSFIIEIPQNGEFKN